MSAERESLAERVRRVQRETGCFDPRELAEEVLATFSSPEEMIEALGEALPLFVRVTVIGERREALSGHPAPAGSPLSRAHQHARGIRAVAKAVLEDLWLEARALHEAA